MDWQNALLGPGWFWSMAGTVLVIVSLVGIYRELRSAGAANALQRLETLHGQWDAPRMAYAKLSTAVHLKSGRVDEEGFFKAQPILDFFVNLDDLESAGHLSIGEIYHLWGTPIEVFSALLAPTMEVMWRRTPGTHDMGPLLAKLRAHERARGRAPESLDNAALKGWLDLAIAMNAAKIRQDSDFQARVIPSVAEAAVSGS